MSTKFEQLLDLLVNEEMDKANELFHDIVVEKSREIYETMIAEEEEDEEDVEESTDDEDDESVEEGFGDQEEESMYEIGGDAADDLVGDTEDPLAMGDDEEEDEFGEPEGDFGGEEGGSEPATKDDILDLASALDEIKAEFAALLAGEKSEEEGNPEMHGGELDAFGDDEESDGEDDSEEVDASAEADEQFMREYKEVVGKPYSGGKVAGKTEDASTNKSSVVSSAKGRPTTTASAKNIAQANTGDQNEKGKAGGLVGNVKGEFTGNHLNKVGGYKGDAFKKDGSGHGAEKKGSGEGSVNSKPIVDRQQ